MSEKVSYSQTETRNKRSLRKAGALLSLVATLATPAVAQARQETSSARATEAAASTQHNTGPKRLRDPAELPGAKIEVSKKTQELSRDSTVQVMVQRPDGSTYYVCTGVKVANNEVDTAAHCAHDITGAEIGLIDVGKPAADFIKVAEAKGLRYLIVDPKVALSFDPAIASRSEQPIARITGMSIPKNVDFMRLKVALINLPSGDSRVKTARLFDQIPALEPLGKGLSIEKPKIGQKVTLSAVPASPGKSPFENPNTLLTQTGTYLGDLTEYSPTASLRHFEAVGLTAKETRGLVICTNGGSGSEFAADVGGKIYTSGPLDREESRNITWRDSSNYPGNSPGEILAFKKKDWNYYSQALGIDLSSYAELCIYSKNVIRGNHSTIQDTENGLGSYVDPSTFKPTTN